MNAKTLQPVRGTHDYHGNDMLLMRHIINQAMQIAGQYGFAEMQTPIFEFSDVFHRSLGETSDVVSKETYTFTDRGGESLTLRPEFTASIVRAFISGGFTQQLPFKAFYAGAAFRYERPQKGRMRQFHQIGVESLGAKEPWQDAEIISLADAILRQLCGDEFCNQYITLELNTLGDLESRINYKRALLDYLTPLKAQLSEESQVRLEKNPLRILDSKQEADKAIIAHAPQLSEHLSDAAQQWFAGVKAALDTLKIAYSLSPRLVRGLDYYTHSVFEFTTTQLGAQATVLAGGRYNGLVAQMGGADIAGVGFAAGIERLMLLLQQQNWQPTNQGIKLALFCEKAEYDLELLKIAQDWRKTGLTCEILTINNFSKALKKAETIKATHFATYENVTINGTINGNPNIRLMDLATRQKSDYLTPEDLPNYLLVR